MKHITFAFLAAGLLALPVGCERQQQSEPEVQEGTIPEEGLFEQAPMEQEQQGPMMQQEQQAPMQDQETVVPGAEGEQSQQPGLYEPDQSQEGLGEGGLMEPQQPQEPQDQQLE